MTDSIKAPKFIHLRLRTAFSLLDGAMTVKKVTKLAKEKGLVALGISDPNLFGALEYSETMAEYGVQPIIGLCFACSMRHDDDEITQGNIALIAKNEIGFSNLMLLSSINFLEGDNENNHSVDVQKLIENKDGLIALSGGWMSPINQSYYQGKPQYAEEWLDLLRNEFPNNFYVEIQRHGRDDEKASEAPLLDYAYKYDIPIVGTNDIRFLSRDKHYAHEVLTCIGTGDKISNSDRKKITEEHYFKSDEEMCALFSDLPECIENTIEIAKRCAVRAVKRKPILPSFDNGKGLTEDDELYEKAVKGLEYRLKTRPPVRPIEEYKERLEYEFGIIKRMGFSGYFLIVSDFITWAKEHDIPVGPGRGSGAGSLVAYSIKITDLDPLEFNLLFERFLNPERISMPDFDVDFCQDRREEVIAYVQEKYGFERVSQIITFGSLQARAAVRDVGRVLDMSFMQVSEVTKLIPNNPAHPVSLKQALEMEDRLKLLYEKDDAVHNVYDTAMELEGLLRNCSTHAAGVVISGRPVKELVPLYKDPKSDIPATQYNMKWAEKAGLVKFDFLGLKTLTVIKKALDLLKDRGIIVDFASQRYDDPEVYDYLTKGHTLGIFQLEGQGMRDTIRKMMPNCLADIIALISLYRPGPMENIPLYCDVKNGLQEPDYLHPSLEPVLKETYGVIIYQEQVMQIAQILSGYTLGEADMLRRAMGKKLKEEMDRQRIRFIDGAKERGVDPELSGSIFDLVNKFAGYGFNKSHAAAYAVVSYQTAYLKTKYPCELLVAAMNLDIEDTTKLGAYVQEAKRIGIKVNPPNVNRSGAYFKIYNGEILYALGAIKNIGPKAMASVEKDVIENGKYNNIYEFVERIGPKNLNKRAIENLAKSGAFADFEPNRALIVDNADLLMAHAAACNNEQEKDQFSLFGDKVTPPRVPLHTVRSWSEQERLSYEFSALGLFLSGHPLDDITEILEAKNTIFFADIMDNMQTSEAVFPMAGVVRASKERPSKKGGKFAWVTLSDPTGEFEAFVKPEELVNARDFIEVGKAVSIVATVKNVEGEIKITASRFDAIENMHADNFMGVKLYIDDNFDVLEFKKLTEQLRGAEAKQSGEVIIFLRVDNDDEIELKLPGRYPIDIPARRAFKALSGVEAIKEF